MPILGTEDDHTPSEELNFSKCTIGNHKNSLIIIIDPTLSEEIKFSKCMISDYKIVQVNLYGVIQSTMWNRH